MPHCLDAGALARLLPQTVSGRVARLDDQWAPSADPAEVPPLGAAPQRRREFLGGRACAHAALSAIGRDDGPTAVGARHEPTWPPGVVGSISHGGEWAGAVVALDVDAIGLGLDIEPSSHRWSRACRTGADRGRDGATPG
ncbi:MAG: hypothetical protein M3Z84_06530 [Actinomycetota bacterium]|nr:hypothetical protein [Actinomycetota bacterium]